MSIFNDWTSALCFSNVGSRQPQLPSSWTTVGTLFQTEYPPPHPPPPGLSETNDVQKANKEFVPRSQPPLVDVAGVGRDLTCPIIASFLLLSPIFTCCFLLAFPLLCPFCLLLTLFLLLFNKENRGQRMVPWHDNYPSGPCHYDVWGWEGGRKGDGEGRWGRALCCCERPNIRVSSLLMSLGMPMVSLIGVPNILCRF